MNQACEYTYRHNSSALARFRNDGVAAVYGLAAAAYATLGENPKALTLFSWFRDWWRETLGALDIMGKEAPPARQRLREFTDRFQPHPDRQSGVVRLGRRPLRQPSMVPAAVAVRRVLRLSDPIAGPARRAISEVAIRDLPCRRRR